jgi:hypothetical protein
MDILEILRDWHADAAKKNEDEAFFIKQIIDELSALRYQAQNPGLNLTVGDWQIIDKMINYCAHKKSCGIIYGRCTCGFEKLAEKYDRVRNPGNYPMSEEK